MDARTQAQTNTWLHAACEDADRRGLPALKPLLEALASSTTALREAERAVREAETAAGTGGTHATTPETTE